MRLNRLLKRPKSRLIHITYKSYCGRKTTIQEKQFYKFALNYKLKNYVKK